MKKTIIPVLFLIFNIYGYAQTLYQVSYYEALNTGKLDGHIAVKELLKHGNTGIGGFHALDGEMIVINGKCYQIPAEGKINIPNSKVKATYAAVFDFKPWKSVIIKSDSNIYKVMDNLTDDTDAVIAIKIHGTFEYIKTRSVPAQVKPYPTLGEIIKTQTVFEGNKIKGTLIGIRTPAFCAGLNPVGYHLHFLSDDKKLGGHLLDMRPSDVKIEIMKIKEFNVVLPSN